jgi:MFS family permease
VDAIERRAAWVTISIAITLAFNASGSVAYGLGARGTWELIFYVAGLLCLGAAGVLLVAALAPDAVRPFSLEDRTRFVFFAFALFVVAMIVIVGLSTHAAIEAHRHPQGFGG